VCLIKFLRLTQNQTRYREEIKSERENSVADKLICIIFVQIVVVVVLTHSEQEQKVSEGNQTFMFKTRTKNNIYLNIYT
jgi:archaellum biogenesis protein FlaJ (TadC family)